MGLFGKKENENEIVRSDDRSGVLGKVSGAIKEKREEAKQLAEKQKGEISTSQKMCIGSGKFAQEVPTTLWKQQDGLVYFGKKADELFEIVSFSWDGPRFSDVTTSETTGGEKGKQKRTGRVIGATVGTVLAPGVGTVIGAAFGTGNKKANKKTKQSTVTSTDTVEVETIATLTMREVATGKIVARSFKGLQSSIIELQDFAQSSIGSQDASIEPHGETNDPYEELKKMKELLDMGVLSQDEFDLKKKELLGL